MKLSQFKFSISENLLATHPAQSRDESRLMVVDRKTGKIEHKVFKDIIQYFGEDDVMILNNTRVFPARLYGNKEKTGAKIEVFLLRELNRESKLWDVLVDPALRKNSATPSNTWGTHRSPSTSKERQNLPTRSVTRRFTPSTKVQLPRPPRDCISAVNCSSASS
jgi:S-adenosylmethionine:tRNA-ribosyltransferase-isomerase (queuine synthetase)